MRFSDLSSTTPCTVRSWASFLASCAMAVTLAHARMTAINRTRLGAFISSLPLRIPYETLYVLRSRQSWRPARAFDPRIPSRGSPLHSPSLAEHARQIRLVNLCSCPSDICSHCCAGCAAPRQQTHTLWDRILFRRSENRWRGCISVSETFPRPVSALVALGELQVQAPAHGKRPGQGKSIALSFPRQ